MADFELLPPRTIRSRSGALVSLVFHFLLVLPFAFHREAVAKHEDPVDKLVVFLVPPDQTEIRERSGKSIDWAGLAGQRGEIKEPIKREEATPPEETLAVGKSGEPEVQPEPTGNEAEPETALTEVEVDSSVVRDPASAAPVYPETLLKKNIEGSTFVHYVVDTTGSVDTLSIRVVRTTHPEFANAVKMALLQMRFHPAIQASRKVRQWVEQNFSFRISAVRAPVAADTT